MRCLICHHPERATIDARLATQSARSLAAQLELSPESLKRHARMHVARTFAAVRRERAIARLRAELARLETPRTCEHCATPIPPTASPLRRFCSDRCRQANSRPPRKLACLDCGVPIEQTGSGRNRKRCDPCRAAHARLDHHHDTRDRRAYFVARRRAKAGTA